jgi:GxxExxY protein
MDIERFDAERRPDPGRLLHGELTGQINAFYATYDTLGYGYLESVYVLAFVDELRARGLDVRCEVPITVWYGEVKVGRFPADILVEDKILIEVKSSEYVTPASKKQLLNYLRATRVEVGLLFHFGPKPFFYRLCFENKNKPSPVLRRGER